MSVSSKIRDTIDDASKQPDAINRDMWQKHHRDWNVVDHVIQKTGWFELEPVADAISFINPLRLFRRKSK